MTLCCAQTYTCIKEGHRGKPQHVGGFSIVELLVVVAIIGVLSGVAIPQFNAYRDRCAITAALADICAMIRETKQFAAADNKDHAIGFDASRGQVTMISGKGPDDKWNTADDEVARSFRLRNGLRFGYGSYGPIPGLADAADGISFCSPKNVLVCNPELTGNSGAVYVIAQTGSAMALTVNSVDMSYKLYRWNGKNWLRF